MPNNQPEQPKKNDKQMNPQHKPDQNEKNKQDQNRPARSDAAPRGK